MDNYKQITLLGDAFAKGATEEVSPYIALDCYYHSDYANKTLSGRDRLISSMKGVYADRDSTDMYYYRIEELASIVLEGISENALSEHPEKLGKYCLILSQYTPDRVVAIVLV